MTETDLLSNGCAPGGAMAALSSRHSFIEEGHREDDAQVGFPAQRLRRDRLRQDWAGTSHHLLWTWLGEGSQRQKTSFFRWQTKHTLQCLVRVRGFSVADASCSYHVLLPMAGTAVGSVPFCCSALCLPLYQFQGVPAFHWPPFRTQRDVWGSEASVWSSLSWCEAAGASDGKLCLWHLCLVIYPL